MPSRYRLPMLGRATTQEKTKPQRAKKAAKPPAARSLQNPDRVIEILDILDRLYPDAHCELMNWHTPLQLLVAVILSAQCTDERVNLVTPALFRRYPDAHAFATADLAELEKLIFSTGFYRNKAKNIRAACQAIVKKYGGEVPRSLEALIELPGVARKTANVVLGTAYGIASGVVVDTHVARLSKRLGLTQQNDPQKIEADLMGLWPRERWIMSSHRLIWHGRRVCYARRPNCDGCALATRCPSAELSTADDNEATK